MPESTRHCQVATEQVKSDLPLRDRILVASVGLVEEKGIGALSLREVARRAGVSHQSPYHYFESRQAILAAIAREGFEQLTVQLQSSSMGATSAPERLQRAGEAYVDFALDRPAHFRLMFRPEHVDLRKFPESFAAAKRALAVLQVIVQENVARGRLPEAGAETLTWAVAHGLAALLLDGPLELEASPAQRRACASRALESMRWLLECGR